MYIQGCNQALGCTILLAGPISEKSELNHLKRVIKRILVIAKNIIYERAYLQMLRVKISPPPGLTKVETELTYETLVRKYEETDKLSPFLIT